MNLWSFMVRCAGRPGVAPQGATDSGDASVDTSTGPSQDDGTRVGIRARLPLTSTPQRRPATLARQLQPATATQLARRPAPDQPRSLRPWVGHLASGVRGCPSDDGILADDRRSVGQRENWKLFLSAHPLEFRALPCCANGAWAALAEDDALVVDSRRVECLMSACAAVREAERSPTSNVTGVEGQLDRRVL
jgi:hypothetical protein